MVQDASRVFSKIYVLDPRPHFSFRVVAKRYWTEDDPDAVPSDSDHGGKTSGHPLTLIFTHASGFHKEHWEPTIYRLFEKQRVGRCSFRFHDMWSFDAPNHGDAAVLNEEVLDWGHRIFSWEDYARSIHAFLTGLGSGVDVDFSKRTLVAVGHCMGATSLMLSTTFFPFVTFSSMHLIEPFLMGKYGQNWGSHLVEGTGKRRDVWRSAEDAFQAMKSRATWQKWDERVLRIYTEQGLRSLPTADYPDRSVGVTLKCTRQQEAATYRDHRSYAIAYKKLSQIMSDIPTHITYGEIHDFLPAEWKKDVLNNASGGVEHFASVTTVPGAGHFIVQTHPDIVADVVWKSLIRSHSDVESLVSLRTVQARL